MQLQNRMNLQSNCTVNFAPTAFSSSSEEKANHDEKHAGEMSSSATIAFLALGSLGDSLPLCALAAAFPRQHSARDARGWTRHSAASFSGETSEVCEKRRRNNHNGGVGETSGGLGTGMRCAVITHRPHCKLIIGVGCFMGLYRGNIKIEYHLYECCYLGQPGPL